VGSDTSPSADPDLALRVQGVTKRFGPTLALDGASLEVHSGEVHALIGENGAGKSTLLGVLAGLLTADAGTMEVAGRPYAPKAPREARERGIALIHQELSLFPHLSVAENVVMGREPARWGVFDEQSARRLALEVLREFGHPEIDPTSRVDTLPIAARQVVEICRAVASRARVVLMDEPTSSLQRPDVERLFHLIRRLAAGGTAVVYISHFLEETREVAERFTVLRDGCTVATGDLARTANEALITAMVGREVSELYPRRAPLPDVAPFVAVEDLSAPPAVKSASFELRRGEVLGIFGLMGSGRTETIRALFGLEEAAGGVLRLRGGEEPVSRGTPGRRLRQGIGYLSEDRKGEGLAPSLSVSDNVTITRLSSCARLGILDAEKQRRDAERATALVGVKAASALQPVRTLSGGNQQKTAIARLLHQDADVLLLDEPTRGVDIGSKAQIYEAIAAVAARGKAVVFVSSYLPELLGLCDRLAVMTRGRLSAVRPVTEWTAESAMEAAISS
jgi:ribose transport system ATP-binding protein